MDIDELGSDCVSSHAPSRASSPGPSALPSTSQNQSPLVTSRLELLRRNPSMLARRDRDRDSVNPLMSRRTSSGSGLRRHRRTLAADRTEPEIEQDLAGTCFDPSGEFVYVAATRGVAEWKVRGAEQRW